MRRSRLASRLVFAGLLLMLAGAGLSSSVIAHWETLNGARALNKLTINVNDANASDASAGNASGGGTSGGASGFPGLTPDDAETLAKAWGNAAITMTARTSSVVRTDSRRADADVVGVDGKYREFAQLHLAAGTSITKRAVDERSRVAVVSADIAWQLFGSLQVIGKEIRIFGEVFKIIGLFAEPDSLLYRMADDGKPDVLVPITALMEVNPRVKVTTVMLAAKDDALLRGTADAKNALAAAGQPPNHFTVVNDALEHRLLAQKPQLMLFLFGLSAILLCLRFISMHIARMRDVLREGLLTLDWLDALRQNRFRLAGHGLAALALAFAAALLWRLIRFRFYLPPDMVPDELIDLSFYADRFLDYWQQRTNAAGYALSPHEMLSSRAALLVNSLFWAGLAIGLPLLYIGVREWAAAGMTFADQTVRASAFLLAAAVLLFVAAHAAGLPYLLRFADLAPPCALCAAFMLHFHWKKES
jgi:hypothetical protein